MAFTWFTWNGAESFVFSPQLPWSFPTGFSKNIPRWQKMPSCKPGWSDLQPPEKLQATQLGKHRKKQHSCPCSGGLVCGKLHHKGERLKLNDGIDFLHMLDGCWFPQKCVRCGLISFLWHCQLYFWTGWEQQKVLMVAELMTKPLCPPMPIQWGCGEGKKKKECEATWQEVCAETGNVRRCFAHWVAHTSCIEHGEYGLPSHHI